MTEQQIRDALTEIIDPEIGVNIVDLGLVYDIKMTGPRVSIVLTMTTPTCPLGSYFKDAIESIIRTRVPEAQGVDVALVREPRWTADMMSAAARQKLNGD